MTRERLNELLCVTGNIIPEAMEDHIGDLETTETELLPRETLEDVMNGSGLPAGKQQALLEALEAANAVPELTEAAKAPDLPYLTFIELRNAIESLGGVCPERVYDDDPEYEALRDLDQI